MISKKMLLQFIDNYRLGGLNDMAKWTVKDGVLFVKCKTDDGHLYNRIEISDSGLPDCEFSVLKEKIGEFVEFISSYNNELEITMNFNDSGIPCEIQITDERKNKGKFRIGSKDNNSITNYYDKDVNSPQFDVVLPLTKEFIKEYTNTKKGAKIVDVVGISGKDNQLHFDFTYCIGSGSNSDTQRDFSYLLDGVIDFDVVTFHAIYLNKVLESNKDFDSAKLSIKPVNTLNPPYREDGKPRSNQALFVEFTKDNCKSTYIFPKINIMKANGK